jgi:hypothetical protein
MIHSSALYVMHEGYSSSKLTCMCYGQQVRGRNNPEPRSASVNELTILTTRTGYSSTLLYIRQALRFSASKTDTCLVLYELVELFHQYQITAALNGSARRVTQATSRIWIWSWCASPSCTARRPAGLGQAAASGLRPMIQTRVKHARARQAVVVDVPRMDEWYIRRMRLQSLNTMCSRPKIQGT